MATGMATRCPACTTVFRVVPDQLRVSDGWVRCGRCAEVFNAGERLVDLETGAPQRMPPADSVPAQLSAATERDFALQTMPPAAAPAPAEAARADAPTSAHAIASVNSLAASTAREHPGASDDADDFVVTDVTLDPPADVADAAAASPDDTDLRADGRSQPEPLPSFVRRADRAARWRKPGVRAALVLVAVLSVLALVGQLGHDYRDLMAARFAWTRPALEQACVALGCSVGAARAIDSLAVDSSGLVRVEKSNVYKLSVVLRNRAGIDIAVPTLDLALTDSQGTLLARRALRLAELGVSQATIPAGRDLSLQATLQAQFPPANDVVAGYTIELFYP